MALTFSPLVRHCRRGSSAAHRTVLDERVIRDGRDRTREHPPLVPADAAVQVGTTGTTLQEVVDRIVALVLSKTRV